MKTEKLNNEKKLVKINFDLESTYAEFLKEAEGCGFNGGVCPIWAKIEDGELNLSLGSPVSANTCFINSDGSVPSSWVGEVDCWEFTGEPEDYKEFELDSPDDFDRDAVIDVQIEDFMRNIQIGNLLEDLKEEITNFCKEKGYEINFI